MIALVALLRLIPYGFAILNAISKGYKWLAIYCFYVMGIALFIVAFSPSNDTRAILASISALILLKHALELPNRKGK